MTNDELGELAERVRFDTSVTVVDAPNFDACFDKYSVVAQMGHFDLAGFLRKYSFADIEHFAHRFSDDRHKKTFFFRIPKFER